MGSGGTLKRLKAVAVYQMIKKNKIKLPTNVPVAVHTVQVPGLLIKDAKNSG